MRAYITYFKLKFITGLQYRKAAYAGIVTQLFFGLVYIMVYIAFYESGYKSLPMKLEQLITYLWLNQAFFSLVCQRYKDSELYKLIREGNIAYELARPKDLYYMWYFKILGQRLADVTLRLVPIIVISMILPKPYTLILPYTVSSFILFIISLITASLLVTAISTLYPILTLLTLNEKGIVNIFMVMADILSGVIVPIPFYPKYLQIISKYLPFQYISDLTFRIYVGNIGIKDGMFGIIIQLFWVFIMINIGRFIMKKNLRRVVVQGG